MLDYYKQKMIKFTLKMPSTGVAWDCSCNEKIQDIESEIK